MGEQFFHQCIFTLEADDMAAVYPGATGATGGVSEPLLLLIIDDQLFCCGDGALTDQLAVGGHKPLVSIEE